MPTSLDNIKSVHRVFIALFVKYPLCFLLCHNQGLHKLNNCGIAYLKNSSFCFMGSISKPYLLIKPPSPLQDQSILTYRNVQFVPIYFSSAGGVNASAGILLFCFVPFSSSLKYVYIFFLL